MASLLNMSGGSLLKKGLPYDAEIEYLESTGTQYIDTLIGNTTDLEFYVKLDNSKQPNQRRSCGYFGARNVWGNFFGVCRGYCLYWVRPTWFSNSNIKGIIEAYCGLENIIINGVSQTKSPDSGNTYKGNINIFMGREGNTQIKVYYIKIYKDSVMVWNAIPVRVGQVGYLYDKVSGKLFGNSGTGNFILGPDKQ